MAIRRVAGNLVPIATHLRLVRKMETQDDFWAGCKHTRNLDSCAAWTQIRSGGFELPRGDAACCNDQEIVEVDTSEDTYDQSAPYSTRIGVW